MFNKIFCKFLYAKCGIISFKNYLLNKKIKTAQDIINHNKIKLLYQKTNFKIFVENIKIKIKIMKIFGEYNAYTIKQNYIIFFKQIAISMSKRAAYKQKVGKVRQIYLINLVKKS